jgi:hypothetical protein
MKIIYISLLSVVLLGQVGYFWHDYLDKKQQASALDSYRAQTANAIAELSKKSNTELDDLKHAVSALGASDSVALQEAEERVRKMFDERCTQLNKDFAGATDGLKQMFDSGSTRLEKLEEQTNAESQAAVQTILANNEQTRQAIESQTNHEISAINNLRLDTLGRLQDAEAQIASLKKQQGLAGSDKELAKHLKERSAKLLDPDAHS